MKVTKLFCDKCKNEINIGKEQKLEPWEKGDYIKCMEFPGGHILLCGKCFNELTKFLGITTISQLNRRKIK